MIVVSERSVLKRGKRNERGINANEVPEKGLRRSEIPSHVATRIVRLLVIVFLLSTGVMLVLAQRDSPPWHMSSAHSFISGYNNNKITSHALTTMTCVFFIPNFGLQVLGIVEKGLDEQTC